MPDTTYERKYYLMREVKKAGFKIIEHENNRIIEVHHTEYNKARKNKHVQELRTKHEFGVQTTL